VNGGAELLLLVSFSLSVSPLVFGPVGTAQVAGLFAVGAVVFVATGGAARWPLATRVVNPTEAKKFFSLLHRQAAVHTVVLDLSGDGETVGATWTLDDAGIADPFGFSDCGLVFIGVDPVTVLFVPAWHHRVGHASTPRLRHPGTVGQLVHVP
jgi:hypothetical protein